jgi:hypothetical protein
VAKKNELAPTEAGASKTIEALVDSLVREFMLKVGEGSTWGKKVTDFPAGKKMLDLDRDEQAIAVEVTLDHILEWERELEKFRSSLEGNQVHGDKPGWKLLWNRGLILRETLEGLLRRKLPLSESSVLRLVSWPLDSSRPSSYMHCLSGLANAVENFAGSNEVGEPLQTVLNKFIPRLRQQTYDKPCRKIADRLQTLLAGCATINIEPGEAWSDATLADLKKMKVKPAKAWNALLIHCQTGGTGKFTERWQDEAQPLINAVGFDVLKEHLLRWFPLVDKPRTQPIERRSRYQPDYNQLLKEPHVEMLRGLVWCCALKEDAELARAVARLALSAYRKIPGKGPRLVSLGNACVTALGTMPGLPPIGQLAILKVKVKFGTAQKEIEKAFNAAAAREKLPRDEVEELAVPSYGLEEVGVLRETFGDYRAELLVDGSSAALHFFKDDKPLKSAPSAVKKDDAAEFKELQAAVKDVSAMLPAQRERIDTLFLACKTWPFAVWKERYLDHPLVGTIARRLVWSFADRGKETAGVFHGDRLVGVNGKPLNLKGDVSVSLWHPIGHPTDDILAWRDFFERREVVQPFKQAHREVYLLTDAERHTGTYSNRFAAHVLRQHQFNALCAARGWKNKLRLMVDDTYPPAYRLLPQWGLRAEYWIEGAGSEYGQDTNDTGTYLYLSTDQVRFYPIGAAQLHAHAGGGGYDARWSTDPDEPLSLEQIPPLVFSEVMRDVDLFVGVASVGNDPNWADGGPRGQYRDYWQSYSFGELSATAQTRKALLERLLPRLKIADRCTLTDRFLTVEGSIRTYKIHLGSGNILMAPNDQYLCIVPKQTVAGAERVFLPFEGDGTLSIILSKAFLLADDAKITDPTITNQLKR